MKGCVVRGRKDFFSTYTSRAAAAAFEKRSLRIMRKFFEDMSVMCVCVCVLCGPIVFPLRSRRLGDPLLSHSRLLSLSARAR